MEENREGQVSPETAETDGSSAAVEALNAAHAEEVRKLRIDGEVRVMLTRMGARNPAVAAKALDLSAVSADENGISGVEESVKRLMESDPYLFGVMPHTPLGRDSSSGAAHGESRREPDTLSDREYYDMILRKR